MAEQDDDRGATPRPQDREGVRPAREPGAPRDSRPRQDGGANRDPRPPRDSRPSGKGGASRDSRPRQNGGANRDSRPPRDSRPRQDGDPKRDFRPHGDSRRQGDSRPRGDGRLPREAKGGARGPRYEGARRDSRPPQDSERRQSDAPELPDAVTARDLHPAARNELKTLSKENAEQVARHLAMAASVIDDDPALALRHAQAAARRAGRVAVVRETVAIAAYATGDFALALRELRTYRRISGRDDQIALLVDSERGVGRPDRAVEAAHAVDATALAPAVRVELAIALSGARLDLGDPERALLELEIPELDPNRAFEYSPGLFAARAAVLEDLGRDDEARQWRERAEAAVRALDDAAAPDDMVVVEEVMEEPEPEPEPEPESESA